MPSVFLSAEAQDDLLVIANALASVSQRSGERFVDGFERVLDVLEQFPHAGHGHADLPRGVRVFSALDCVVLYTVTDEDRVEVLRMVHGKTDFKRIFGPRRPR